MADRAQKYRQAAIAYLIYGLLYLGGAIYAASTGMSERASLTGGSIGWFILGSLVVALFPYLIWSGYKWFTRILAVLLMLRITGLIFTLTTQGRPVIAMPGGAQLPGAIGTLSFLFVTLVTFGMLVRAGWNLAIRGPKQHSS